jgi:hypothetical protein
MAVAGEGWANRGGGERLHLVVPFVDYSRFCHAAPAGEMAGSLDLSCIYRLELGHGVFRRRIHNAGEVGPAMAPPAARLR